MNSNEKEGKTNEISLSLDLIDLFVYSNTTVLELQTLYCSYFFQNVHFQIRGAAYLRMRLIHGRLRYSYFNLMAQCNTKLDRRVHNKKEKNPHPNFTTCLFNCTVICNSQFSLGNKHELLT